MEEKKSYLFISVDKAEYERISAILMTFSKHGYFDNQKIEVSYVDTTNECRIVINDLRSCRKAFLIGDMLEAVLGKDVQWFHYSEDPEDDE